MPSFCSPTFLNWTAIFSIFSKFSSALAYVIFCLSIYKTLPLRSSNLAKSLITNLSSKTPIKIDDFPRKCDAVSISFDQRDLVTILILASSSLRSATRCKNFVALFFLVSNELIYLLSIVERLLESYKNYCVSSS